MHLNGYSAANLLRKWRSPRLPIRQARNAAKWAEEEDFDPAYLIQDRDGKSLPKFGSFCKGRCASGENSTGLSSRISENRLETMLMREKSALEFAIRRWYGGAIVELGLRPYFGIGQRTCQFRVRTSNNYDGVFSRAGFKTKKGK